MSLFYVDDELNGRVDPWPGSAEVGVIPETLRRDVMDSTCLPAVLRQREQCILWHVLWPEQMFFRLFLCLESTLID